MSILSNPLHLRTLHGEYDQERKLLLFELSTGGHYPGYILHLVQYWCEHNFTGWLDVVVSSKLLVQHQEVLESISGFHSENVNFVAITQEEEKALAPRTSSFTRTRRAFQEWQLVQRYTSLLKSTHCLLLYFDTRQLPLALGKRLSCPFSGIYFRPTIHYPSFDDFTNSWKDQLQRYREWVLLSRILPHPQLKTLFCLDPFIVERLNQRNCGTQAIYLPDPVKIYADSQSRAEHLRQQLDIKSGRRVFLLMGALEARKGIYKVLEAIGLIPPELNQKLCLLMVGPLQPDDKLKVQVQITSLTYSTSAQIIIRDQFIPDSDVQPYFYATDVVLAPYQLHVGMSAILVRAAAAQKPLLSQSYGLMGEITRQYQLGITVDSSSANQIAQALIKFLTTPLTEIGDRTRMKTFADRNTAENFASTIFQHL